MAKFLQINISCCFLIIQFKDFIWKKCKNLFEKNTSMLLHFYIYFSNYFQLFSWKNVKIFQNRNWSSGNYAGSLYLTLSRNISGNGSPSGIRSWVKTEISKFNYNKWRFNYGGVVTSIFLKIFWKLLKAYILFKLLFTNWGK